MSTRTVRQKMGRDEWLQRLLIACIVLVLFITVLMPLGDLFSKAFINETGEYIGLANFIKYFETPALVQSFVNTMYVSGVTTILSVTLAFLYAFALTRTNMRGKVFFRYVALLPLFAPTMMHGIALTYLFGNQGIITTGFFGVFPGFEVELYGPLGIILSELFYTFPQAYLILAVSLAFADYNLYEAAETMGASKLCKFLTVTLPNVKYGLVSAIFVCFTLSFTDFGAPKVVGGQFNVLATDIYKQVIGQQNTTMGATVGIILILPAILAFIVDRIVERKQNSSVNAKSTPYKIVPQRGRDNAFFVYCSLITATIFLMLITVILASLVKVWPYDLTMTVTHYDFSKVAGEGMQPFWNSVLVAFYSAVAGTVVTFINAYLIEKTRFMKGMRQVGYFLSILPLALPGLVIGLAYIFFFNHPDNPLNWMYGSIVILILANVIHFYAVPFISATTALKKLDKEFELASESMGVPFYVTFWRVTVPMSLPAILENAVYYFINSMVTISAVVFLYSADFKLASVSIVNMDDAGDVAPAAAMSVLIVLTNVLVRIIYEIGTKKLREKTGAWQKR
ncbi:putative 2-aminoethylphosphonate ABC transporter permease subunit [Brevibacillus sp. FSL K6-0770]|uniref:Phosphonate ABC transporter permease n=1 Tax=Brevibacillus parabrevis TaxID=54914 RepID=A0A4Y3PQN1_BREPA|nr:MULTISPECIES: putative 2-aminoethylphosphonate ABC transporter permease subunit [Brevibacillus]MED2253360.1 putative 2-aminoethylphosphonate ABC transporter permease subunit [Brevibacillus parabrevis]NRQ55848.1 putative 2-aminoethylphosphonate ABC transporter permease subunit [Brevibacillus sp. HD1.4A]RNB95161.1 putative 2-aminoethylphosphonate ABC transporter permease subunit [Brevibacillus parabrevis]GEB35225.1 phosphonate ABC transporter permease [Brevibacillus parabrevis]